MGESIEVIHLRAVNRERTVDGLLRYFATLRFEVAQRPPDPVVVVPFADLAPQEALARLDAAFPAVEPVGSPAAGPGRTPAPAPPPTVPSDYTRGAFDARPDRTPPPAPAPPCRAPRPSGRFSKRGSP